jgi:hypothetical protein
MDMAISLLGMFCLGIASMRPLMLFVKACEKI